MRGSRTGTRRHDRRLGVISVAVLTGLLAACGGAGDAPDRASATDDVAQAAETAEATEDAETVETAEAKETADDAEFGDAVAEAMGAGGGGTLTFDGAQITIDSVVCQLSGETVEVGTVSASGHRVLISRTASSDRVAAKVLDPESQQWTPADRQVDGALREGSSFTSGPSTYVASGVDGTVEVSFTLECP